MEKSIVNFDVQEIVEHSPLNEVKKNIGSSFFRGKDCNFNPYKVDFEKSDFVTNFLLKGWLPAERFVSKETRITAFGSCFASNITNYLSQLDYSLSKFREPNIYISSMSEGLVNIYSLVQQFEWALEDVPLPNNLWHGSDGAEFDYNEDIRIKTKEVFLGTDLFIITLGLSEIWYDELTGGTLWRAVPINLYDPARHKFRVASFQETKHNLQKIYDLIVKHTKAKIVFTLSPVPLAATFRPISCMTANSVSKAILRAALDEFIRDNWIDVNDKLFYFPAYEIVTQLFRDSYLEDNRHPRPEIINFIMKLFENTYCQTDIKSEEVEALYANLKISY